MGSIGKGVMLRVLRVEIGASLETFKKLLF